MTDLLTDDELRRLQENASLVQEMMRHPGWDVLVDFLHMKMRGDKLRLLNNQVDDFDEYRKISGRLVGIHFVLDAPKNIQELVDNEIRRRAEKSASE